MAYIVIKYSVMEGNESTNQRKSFGGLSPVRLTLSNGQTFTWGPNQSHTLPFPFGEEALAADNRLKEVSRS